MRALRPKAVMLGLASSTIGCDRITKHVAAVALAGAPGRSFLADTLRLEYAENRGAFLSLGAQLPEDARIGLFTVGTGLLLAVLAWLALRRGWSRRDAAGLTLIWAGGVSNLIDRAARGSVIDFLSVGVGSLRTGIFNVADLAIVVGVTVVAYGRGMPAKK